MTTTIDPTPGHGLLMTQQGVGSSPGYDAIDARRFWSAGLQEGILSSGSYEVTQRAAGANLSVDIAASTGDGALVKGDAITGQGLYLVAPHTAVINEAIAAADGSNPRVDRVILEIKDNEHDASGSNLAQVRVISGTATSGATLDNLTGSAAVPSSAILLADVHVPASDTSIANTQIRDRRRWAAGAYYSVAGGGGGDYTTTSTTDVDVAAGYTTRIECSGVPLEADFIAVGYCGILLGVPGKMTVMVDMDGTNIAQTITAEGADSADIEGALHVAARTTPSAGSHLLKVQFKVTGGTGTIINSGSVVPRFTIREMVKANAANNATTSG